MTYTMDRAGRKLLICCDSCKRGLDYAYGWKGDGSFAQFKEWAEKDFAKAHKCPPATLTISAPKTEWLAWFWLALCIAAIVLAFSL